MKNWIAYISISLLFSLQSCERESKYIFEDKLISNLQNVEIKDVIAIEKLQHAIERKDSIIDYRMSLAFNYSKIETLNRKVFHRKDSSLFLLTDYYYHKKDSTLKFIIYTWSENASGKFNVIKKINKVDNVINQKFKELQKTISMQLGKPSTKLGLKKDVALWERENANVFMTILNGETQNQGVYLFIEAKKNGL
jgi:hypothetical protein